MVLCAGSIFGDGRIVGQSSAEACSQISCSPGDWPDDVVQKLAGINHHHVWSIWSHDRDDTERLDEHRLVRAGGTGLEDIGYINGALLPHD